MVKLREKLNSRRGASLVIAMLFFLICAMIASVIMTAAMSNSGRTEKQRDEQQAYLAASSAARLVRDDMENISSFTARRITTTYTCRYEHDEQTQPAWENKDISGNDGACGGSEFAELVTEAAFFICKGNNEYTKTLTLTADELTGVTVTVNMRMDKKYNLSFLFDAVTEKGGEYKLLLSVPGTSVPTENSIWNASDTHKETSLTPVLQNGEWVYPEVDNNYQVMTKTETVTVSWARGTLSKGE